MAAFSTALVAMWTQEGAIRLGNALRTLRATHGLSQETVAHRAGITKNQLQLIEAGRSTGRADATGPSNPRMATLAGLANVLEVSVAELMATAKL
ncbi:helix-turn-helix domain-containing protein [Microbacterium enclense]|uniref:Helix-turn-helix domain-containing protein n=1 Tax=Microbacterium enclense TaxID=993073 RepID=A0A1G6JE38_9MICO|nr:helix-turn-helix transcriptional regulator [Microbacterium enclense]SDC16917.1 Helix-turn-helix domain-containing protein [Microbacterium enclense]